MQSAYLRKFKGLRLLMGGLVLSSFAPLALAVLPISNPVFAAPPSPPPGCPEGWVPAPNPQLGCVPNRVQVKPNRPFKRRVTNSTQSSEVKFPSDRPKDFTYNKCELGIVDPVDCPENNPISPSRD